MKSIFSKNSLRPALVIMGGLALMTSTACTTYIPSYGPTTERNPIQISESVERLELYTRADGLTLSARDRDAVGMFLQGYGQSGDGPLYINVPSNGSGAAIGQAKNIIRQDMASLGLSGAAVQTGQYQAAPGSPAPVVVSYRRLKAVAEDCRRMESLTMTSHNQPSSSFGCAHSSNLAMMIQDPRQLLEPYPFAESNSARRMTVYDKYIKGENTATPQPPRQQISSEE